MRVHLAVLFAVCTAATSNATACYKVNMFESMNVTELAHDVGPLPIRPSRFPPTAASYTTATPYCAGWEAGWSQGWEDVKGSQVPSPTAPSCHSPICGSETYDDGYVRGRTAGSRYAESVR